MVYPFDTDVEIYGSWYDWEFPIKNNGVKIYLPPDAERYYYKFKYYNKNTKNWFCVKRKRYIS